PGGERRAGVLHRGAAGLPVGDGGQPRELRRLASPHGRAGRGVHLRGRRGRQGVAARVADGSLRVDRRHRRLRRGPMSAAPSLRIERRLLREGRAAVACVDEVGRGALSGPVTVGMVLVTPQTRTAPRGVRDSKLLTPQARRDLVPRIERWAAAHAVGHATAAEIDRYGIITAMRLAGHRAVALLSPRPDLLLLDGNHDYLTDPDQGALFAPDGLVDDLPPVMTMVKADLRCAAVAAASILAKTTRDAIMVDLAAEHPEYGWDVNK